MRRKTLFNKGFTVVEVLIAVAILAVFVSMAAVGTSGLFGTGEKMMAVSKAAVLGSDVMQVITNELRYGENFAVDSKKVKKSFSSDPEFDKNGYASITFNSATYGDGLTMKVSKSGDIVVNNSSGSPQNITLNEGVLIVQKTSKTETSELQTFIPIGTAAYDEVHIKTLTFTCVYDNKSSTTYVFKGIRVDLVIEDAAGNDLWSNSVSINPLWLTNQ